MSNQDEKTIIICHIDLSANKRKIIKKPLHHGDVKKFLGGVGTVIDFLLEKMPAKVDPLGPENYICFISGFLSGTNIPFSGRFTVAGKSPLTGTWGESNCGGRFGPELRKTGIDILLVTGKAKRLSTILITDEIISIKSAKYLKGKDCIKTELHYKKIYGSKYQIASIGPAGENKVLISGIVTDGGRIAARSGLGAVMGSKNLKAIVVKGNKKPFIHYNEQTKKLKLNIIKNLKRRNNRILRNASKLTSKFSPWIRRTKIKDIGKYSPNSLMIESYKRWGTSAITAMAVEIGDAPVKNWKGSYKDFPLAKSVKLTSDNITEHQIKKYGCKSCPIACGGIIKYTAGKTRTSHKPEYETLAMLGSNLLNANLNSIFQLNDYCNRMGIDTIAVGSILGYLIESQEKNLISSQQTDGIEVRWGESGNYLQLIELLVNRKGIGNILAQGFNKMVEYFGKETENIAIHINNQAIPAHDPRFKESQWIPYIIDPSPGRHTPFIEVMADLSRFTKMFPSLDSKKKNINFYFYHQVASSLGLCQFGLTLGQFPVIEFVNLVTGYLLDIHDFLAVGERIFTLKHLFNLREGINPLKYSLPKRLIIENDSKKEEINDPKALQTLQEFLEFLNWNMENFSPSTEKLSILGLEKHKRILQPKSEKKIYQTISS